MVSAPIRPSTPPGPTLGSYTTIAGLLRMRGGVDAPPNSPRYNLSPVAVHRNRKASTGSPNLAYKVDFRGISYVELVDENLMCPICRCALIDPVTTDCDHTFCIACIDEALVHQDICPIDRLPLGATAYSKSPKVVYNQLDNLKARCPCCDITVPRSMIINHLERYCMEASIQCPGTTDPEKNCKETVKRKLADSGCLHYLTSCPDCQVIGMQIEMGEHREQECKERNIRCELCDEEILKCKQAEHDEKCINKVLACKWGEFGCDHQGKRGEQLSHLLECAFRTVGPMAELFKKQIGDLQSEVRALNEKNEIQERRIKFLEKGNSLNDHSSDHHLSSYADLSASPFQSLPNVPSPYQMEPAQEYFLSLLEAQEHRVSRLATDLTDLDSKQTVMLFNETMPIKNEMAEIRSNLQVTSTHVRFLMRLRLQENQQRRYGGWGAPAAPGNAPTPAGNGSAVLPSSPEALVPRRLSDTTRDNLTRL